jgi:hypothetical protein
MSMLEVRADSLFQTFRLPHASAEIILAIGVMRRAAQGHVVGVHTEFCLIDLSTVEK